MGTTPKLYQRIFLSVTGGLPLFFVSGLLLTIWIDPMSVDYSGWLKITAYLVLVEFLLLHSGAFMAVGPIICPRRWQRLGWFEGTIMILQRSALGMILLLLSVLVCLISWPDLGITGEIRLTAFGMTDDILSRHPERMIA